MQEMLELTKLQSLNQLAQLQVRTKFNNIYEYEHGVDIPSL